MSGKGQTQHYLEGLFETELKPALVHGDIGLVRSDCDIALVRSDWLLSLKVDKGEFILPRQFVPPAAIISFDELERKYDRIIVISHRWLDATHPAPDKRGKKFQTRVFYPQNIPKNTVISYSFRVASKA